MNLDFTAALAYLRTVSGARFEVDMANAARPDAARLFTRAGGVLPARQVRSYFVRNAGILIRSTMAGLVGEDSIPGPIGAAEMVSFLANTAKYGGHVRLPEAMLREMQATADEIQLGGGDSTRFVVNNILNFVEKLLIQPVLDTYEYLAARACQVGAIDWTFNQKRLQVDYAVPAGNLFAQRTLTESYVAGTVNNGSASKFWTDWRAGISLLGGQPVIAIATPNTINGIVENPANSIFLTFRDTFGNANFDRIVNTTTDRRSEDIRNQVSLTAYNQSGNIFDLTTPGQTVQVPFLSDGYIIMVGAPRRNEFGVVSDRGDEEGRLGFGNETPDPNAPTIGYTHIGPTVENGGRTGIWSRVDVPWNMPMQLDGLVYSNGLPMLEQVDRLVVLRTTTT